MVDGLCNGSLKGVLDFFFCQRMNAYIKYMGSGGVSRKSLRQRRAAPWTGMTNEHGYIMMTIEGLPWLGSRELYGRVILTLDAVHET